MTTANELLTDNEIDVLRRCVKYDRGRDTQLQHKPTIRVTDVAEWMCGTIAQAEALLRDMQAKGWVDVKDYGVRGFMQLTDDGVHVIFDYMDDRNARLRAALHGTPSGPRAPKMKQARVMYEGGAIMTEQMSSEIASLLYDKWLRVYSDGIVCIAVAKAAYGKYAEADIRWIERAIAGHVSLRGASEAAKSCAKARWYAADEAMSPQEFIEKVHADRDAAAA